MTLTATVSGNQSQPATGVVLFFVGGYVVGSTSGVALTPTYKGDKGTVSLVVN